MTDLTRSSAQVGGTHVGAERLTVTFNEHPVVLGRTVTSPSEAAIKNTPGLWHASLDDAYRYGGEVTRHVLGHMNIRGDREHVVVDTKVHMLLPGFLPAIPGWHTDGVPRWDEKAVRWTAESGLPSMGEQARRGDGRAPRFHLYVSGSGCLTRFMTEPVQMDVPDLDADLYAEVSGRLTRQTPTSTAFPGRVIEWDWWNLHTAQKATKREWRFLCRVTETDMVRPEADLRSVIRTQEQVYVPEVFGW